MAKSESSKKDGDLPIRRLIARRNRALQRFDNQWRDAAGRACSEEDAEVAYLLATSDDPPNPIDDPGGIPPPPPPPPEGEEETTRTVSFSVRRSEKRVTRSDGELTVKYSESSSEVMHTTSSDDPAGPFDGPIDPIPPPPDPPEELMRLASGKPHGAHGTFQRRREELCRRFDRQIEHTRDWQKQKRLT